MTGLELVWSQSALEDLEILRKGLARDSRAFADRITDRVFECVERTPSFPRIGRLVAEVDDESVREFLLRTLRVVYQVEAERIVVLTILEGGRALERRESRRWEA